MSAVAESGDEGREGRRNKACKNRGFELDGRLDLRSL